MHSYSLIKVPQLDQINPKDFREGVLMAINKPLQWTSFDVVNKIKVAAKYKWGIPKIKIGHAGTLDPLASGLLLICSGRMTKEIEQYQAAVKTYEGEFMLGSSTPSFDLETDILERYPVDHITDDMIAAAVKTFLGKSDQVPPVYSAVKKDGKRLYDYARRGKTITPESRKIEIYEFEADSSCFPLVSFRVVCSKGTYIRSLASDFGKSLGSGAYLHKLIRTGIGDFSLDQSWELDDFLEQISTDKADNSLI